MVLKQDFDKSPLPNKLLDNNISFDLANRHWYKYHVNNLNQDYMQLIQDQIKNLKSVGISPTQLMNTEIEAKRMMQSQAGSGNIAVKKNRIE